MSSKNDIPTTAQHENTEAESPPPPVGFLAYLCFPLFWIFFVGTLLVFDPLQRIALLGGLRFQQKIVRILNRALAFSLKITATRVRTTWRTQIDPAQNYVILSNHQSLFDLPLLDVTFADLHPRYVSKQELGHWIPSVSFNLRHGGNALIDRKNPRQSIPAIRALGQRMLELGFSVVLFPEGTRARRGVLKEFRAGGIGALLDAHPNAKILPVVIDGSWQLSARRFLLPVGTTVNITVLPELSREGKSAKMLVDEAHDIIAAELQRLRSA